MFKRLSTDRGAAGKTGRPAGRVLEAVARVLGGRPVLRLRRVQPPDVPLLQDIQNTAAEAAQWLPQDYLNFDCHVALLGKELAGFLVSRRVAEDEREILNVAVAPRFRRRGVATALIRAELTRWPGGHFLEVRESNLGARALYERLGFEQAGRRPEYYDEPPEAGIVMRIYS